MYYGLLVATQASRIHIVSVPVDIGVCYATRAQDMAIERWLDSGFNSTQNVVNLDVNFEPLFTNTSNSADENLVYTLVMETQERLSFVCRPLRVFHRMVNHIYRGHIATLSTEDATTC